jgi:hypothetical protein
MLAISISINILWLPVLMMISAFVGFLFRSQQIIKLKKQVSSLEKEMLNSHAEILQLHEEIVRVQTKQTNSQSLVVSMKDVSGQEENKELLKDISKRKKVK